MQSQGQGQGQGGTGTGTGTGRTVKERMIQLVGEEDWTALNASNSFLVQRAERNPNDAKTGRDAVVTLLLHMINTDAQQRETEVAQVRAEFNLPAELPDRLFLAVPFEQYVQGEPQMMFLQEAAAQERIINDVQSALEDRVQLDQCALGGDFLDLVQTELQDHDGPSWQSAVAPVTDTVIQFTAPFLSEMEGY